MHVFAAYCGRFRDPIFSRLTLSDLLRNESWVLLSTVPLFPWGCFSLRQQSPMTWPNAASNLPTRLRSKTSRPMPKSSTSGFPPLRIPTGRRSLVRKRSGPEAGEFNTEPQYGNLMYHKRFTAPFPETVGAELVFDIHRQELVVPEAKGLDTTAASKAPDKMAAYLASNRLIPTDGRIDTIAQQIGLEGKPPIVAARAIYDYLIDEFKYNYMAEGAGKGDVLWACDSKTGDCTDYHSMFLALCRNQGIPATHEFGFPIRTKNPSGKIPYYHCWARFHVEGIGWIPIDASEADKHPELFDYNFGSQTADLMKFTNGRDLILAPPQQGPPLNYFAHAYAENRRQASRGPQAGSVIQRPTGSRFRLGNAARTTALAPSCCVPGNGVASCIAARPRFTKSLTFFACARISSTTYSSSDVTVTSTPFSRSFTFMSTLSEYCASARNTGSQPRTIPPSL